MLSHEYEFRVKKALEQQAHKERSFLAVFDDNVSVEERP